MRNVENHQHSGVCVCVCVCVCVSDIPQMNDVGSTQPTKIVEMFLLQISASVRGSRGGMAAGSSFAVPLTLLFLLLFLSNGRGGSEGRGHLQWSNLVAASTLDYCVGGDSTHAPTCPKLSGHRATELVVASAASNGAAVSEAEHSVSMAHAYEKRSTEFVQLPGNADLTGPRNGEEQLHRVAGLRPTALHLSKKHNTSAQWASARISGQAGRKQILTNGTPQVQQRGRVPSAAAVKVAKQEKRGAIDGPNHTALIKAVRRTQEKLVLRDSDIVIVSFPKS